MSVVDYIKVIVAAGIVATTTMTLFVLLINRMSEKRLNVIRILGTMLTGQTSAYRSTSGSAGSLAVGIIAHYMVGFLFLTIYVISWENDWLGYSLTDSAIIGFVTGLFGIVVWRIYFSIHGFPPSVHLGLYLTVILLGHVLFGVSAGWIYQLMTARGT